MYLIAVTSFDAKIDLINWLQSQNVNGITDLTINIQLSYKCTNFHTLSAKLYSIKRRNNSDYTWTMGSFPTYIIGNRETITLYPINNNLKFKWHRIIGLVKEHCK